MTPQEAIELVEQCGLNIEGIKNIECESVIISALEKQIPKKPVIPFDSIRQEYECPVCPHKVDKTQLYCGKCGQALDWGDSE